MASFSRENDDQAMELEVTQSVSVNAHDNWNQQNKLYIII
jgi:hypothetical protein